MSKVPRDLLHDIVSPLASAAGDISNMLDGTVEPTTERLSRVQDAIERAINAARGS